MQAVAVIGAGTMGHGIAQVFAMADYDVTLVDASEAALDKGLAAVVRNLDKGVNRGKVTNERRSSTLARLSGAADLAVAVEAADLVIEAVPESLTLKQSLFTQAQKAAPASAIFATNTSSLSIAKIAGALTDPGRVIGMHFFNPVHIMALLEVVVGKDTRDDVLGAVKTAGERIGKEVIVVRDSPGFATSRLGVCLGMEAIRMVEEGVASPADIDKAMVLGYRHPIGPLKLTDLVGLDVRMAIGEYLSKELGNDAFTPPQLMRDMVAAGNVGKKAGKGFFDWSAS